MTVSRQESGAFNRQIDDEQSVTAAGSAVKAGLAYFASVFAIGFLLGMIRVPFLAPLLGDLIAVLIELPIILTSAWLMCGKLVRSFHVAPTFGSRFAMGGYALVVLLIAELALSTLVFGNSINDHLYRICQHLKRSGWRARLRLGCFLQCRLHWLNSKRSIGLNDEAV